MEEIIMQSKKDHTVYKIIMMINNQWLDLNPSNDQVFAQNKSAQSPIITTVHSKKLISFDIPLGNIKS